MNPRQLRLGLMSACGGFAAAIPLLMIWGFLWPVDSPADAAAASSMRRSTNVPRPPTSPTLEDFGVLLEKPLRHQLMEPKPAESQVRVARKVVIPLQLKLMATMVETEQSSALFSLPDGQLQVGRVGQSVGKATPVEVVEIKPAKVVVRHQSQLVTLEIPRAGANER